MKLLLTVLLTFSAHFLFATDDFNYNQNELNNEFQALNSLETAVENDRSIQLENLVSSKSELVQDLNIDQTATNSSFSFYEEMPLVNGFWWGCCLGIVGLALVYFITDNNKAEVKIAFWGCIISTLFWGIGGIWNPFSW